MIESRKCKPSNGIAGLEPLKLRSTQISSELYLLVRFKSTHAEPDSPVAYKLADGILIAHGNLIESIAENKLGLRQYNTVRKNDKTDQGS